MLSHFQNFTMPHTFSSSVNRTSVAMSSLATASSCSQVHVNGSAVPAAASRFIHVNGSAVPAAASHVNGSVVPATASRSAHVDDITQMLNNMSIDKPTTVKSTSASSSRTYASKLPLAITAATSASKGCPPLRQHQSLATSSVNSTSVLERIAERRRRVIANTTSSVNRASIQDRIAERRRRVNTNNLAADDQRPKPSVKFTPTSTRKSSSTSSRVLSEFTPTSTHKSSSTSSRVRPALTAQLLSSLSTTTVPDTPVDSSLIANDGSFIGDESSNTTATITQTDLPAVMSELTYVAVRYP